jgi:hypothetical protein
MNSSHSIKRRAIGAAIATLGLAAATSASAEIKFIDFFSPAHDGRVCNPAANILDYPHFVASQRISIARNGTVRVRLIGDFADFATGATDSIAGVNAHVFRRGTMDRPGASPMFGGMPQIGYVDVDVDVGPNATLGNGDARALWASGSERIPLRIVDACPSSAPSGGTGSGSAAPPPAPRPIIGGSVATTSTPDLVPQFAPLGLLRRASATSRQIDATFCSSLPVPRDQRQAAVGEITVGSPRWGVINASNTAIANAFQVRLSAGPQVLDTQTVNGVAGGGSQLFTFTRPQSRTRVVLVGPLTDLAVRNQYGGLGCFQAIMAAGDPLNWEDPRYTVQVDVANAVNEGAGGEINNVLTF